MDSEKRSFFEEFPEFAKPVEKSKPAKHYAGLNDTTGECYFCGALSDDVILGVCGDCC